MIRGRNSRQWAGRSSNRTLQAADARSANRTVGKRASREACPLFCELAHPPYPPYPLYPPYAPYPFTPSPPHPEAPQSFLGCETLSITPVTRGNYAWNAPVMRPIAMLLTLALGISAFASNAPDWLVGSYRLELSSDLKSAAQKLGVPEPYARIMLRPDGTFSYASNKAGNVTGANGNYELNDRSIKLTANDVFPAQGVKTLTGRATEGALEIDGLRYVKANASVDIVGSWNVHNGERIDKSIKMIFRENHTFEFDGMAASSKGRYEVDGDKLTLIWTEVDGQAVEAGSMRKALFLRDDGCFFIDNYRYVRN